MLLAAKLGILTSSNSMAELSSNFQPLDQTQKQILTNGQIYGQLEMDIQ